MAAVTRYRHRSSFLIFVLECKGTHRTVIRQAAPKKRIHTKDTGPVKDRTSFVTAKLGAQNNDTTIMPSKALIRLSITIPFISRILATL